MQRNNTESGVAQVLRIGKPSSAGRRPPPRKSKVTRLTFYRV